MHWFHTLPIGKQLRWINLLICGLVLLLAASAIAVYEVFDFRRALVRETTVLADVVATNVSGSLAFDDETAGRGVGEPFGYLFPLLGASLMASYVMYGFDTAGTLAEETTEPRRRAVSRRPLTVKFRLLSSFPRFLLIKPSFSPKWTVMFRNSAIARWWYRKA